MLISLLLVTFLISLLVSFITARIFNQPLKSILERIIPEAISAAWLKYLHFAIYVLGISNGVKIWELEKYISPQVLGEEGAEIILSLNPNRWALEIYRTVIGTLSGIAVMLLVFFIFALVAYVIIRIFEGKKQGG
ncbi:MAG: hypothetical protein GX088_04095 [Clostridia bacterium]|nr:hypothetical protein [Clostridia bacterium]